MRFEQQQTSLSTHHMGDLLRDYSSILLSLLMSLPSFALFIPATIMFPDLSHSSRETLIIVTMVPLLILALLLGPLWPLTLTCFLVAPLMCGLFSVCCCSYSRRRNVHCVLLAYALLIVLMGYLIAVTPQSPQHFINSIQRSMSTMQGDYPVSSRVLADPQSICFVAPSMTTLYTQARVWMLKPGETSSDAVCDEYCLAYGCSDIGYSFGPCWQVGDKLPYVVCG
jgi:hypothetical protein